jgi:hypothetical protein
VHRFTIVRPSVICDAASMCRRELDDRNTALEVSVRSTLRSCDADMEVDAGHGKRRAEADSSRASSRGLIAALPTL